LRPNIINKSSLFNWTYFFYICPPDWVCLGACLSSDRPWR